VFNIVLVTVHILALLLLVGMLVVSRIGGARSALEMCVAAFFSLVKLFGASVLFLLILVLMVGVAGFVGFLLWLTTPIIAIMILTRYRESERRTLLWALAVAAEKGIPLSSSARAFADERRDGLGRRAEALAEALDRGMPLDKALSVTGNPLPTDALVAVRTGCRTGDLGTALKSAARAAGPLQATIHRVAAQLVYVTMYVCIAALVITFLNYKIVPEFIKIFDGFGLKLPGVMILMVNLSYTLVRHDYLLFFFVLGLGAVLLFALARYTGLVRWDPPLVRRLWRRLDSAIILRALAQGVDRQESMSSTLSSLAEIFPKRHVRDQLAYAQRLVSGGVSWCDSLVAARLIRPAEASILSVAERLGNLSWALGEVADSQIRRFTARTTAVQAVVFPLIIFVASIAVLGVGASVVMSMADLITNLT